MALSKTIKLKTNFGDDVTFNNAYIKAENISGTKDKLTFDVYFFKAANGTYLKKETFEFVPNLEGKNFFAQAYVYLKSLPEFAGAQDC